MERPGVDEYHEFYQGYVSLIESSDILSVLSSQSAILKDLLGPSNENLGIYAYAPEKWTVNELLGHITDTERIFAYRVLRISRRDNTPIEGFEQDGYILNANFNVRTTKDLIEEFAIVRASNLYLFNHLNDEDWLARGTANGASVSVKALAWIMAGHTAHHLNILKERYLTV